MCLEVPERLSDHRDQEASPEETDPQALPPDSSHPSPNASAPVQTLLPIPAAERDFERVGKMAYSWAITLLSISVTLLLTGPCPIDHPDRVVLYAASTVLACLSIIAALFLIYYSVLSHPGAQLAKVQETVMGFSAVTLALAAFSRLALLITFRRSSHP